MKLLFLSTLFLSFLAFGSPQGVPVQTIVTIGTSSTLVVGANLNRGYLLMQNQGTGNCYVRLDGKPITANGGLLVQTLQNYEVIEGYSKTAVYAMCDTSSVWVVLETNY